MKRINALIADDIYANQFLLASILEELNCNINMAENGKQALDLLKTEKVDIIFMDIEMPVMNGIEATGIIKNDDETKNIPVVALTAHNLEDFMQEISGAGFDAILEKPYSYERISEVLTKFTFE